MERVSINLLEIGEKARSKSELYKILIVEGALYLPPDKFCSVDFMADIIEGKRDALVAGEVVMRALPHIAGLRTEDLLRFLIEECDAERYLPPKYNEINIHRDWLGNLCNSLGKDQFCDYVKEKLSNRKKSIISSKNLSVEALPRYAELFKSSLMVSTHKGKSNLMLNRVKRFEREEKERQEETKSKEKEEQIDRLQREVNLLKAELDNTYDPQEKANKNASLLGKLFNNNVIDEDGNLINPNNYSQHE